MKRRPTTLRDETGDGIYVPPPPEPDLADMDRMHRLVASDQRADLVAEIASRATEH